MSEMQLLPTTNDASGSVELSTVAAARAVEAEIHGAIVVAQNRPRNEDEAFAALMKTCQSKTFAAAAIYSFPRGGSKIEGPSVDLAREAARCWGNVRSGVDIVREDDTHVHIRGWAWDLQTNTKTSSDDHFKKEVQRKNKQTGQTEWVVTDERDRRELVNRRGAILERNAILKLIPKHLIEDAMDKCRGRMRSKAAEDPDRLRKEVITAFGDLNVEVKDLEGWLGKKVGQASPKELEELRVMYTSIKGGESTWSDYVLEVSPAEGTK